jgi:hypothetical protein
MKKVLSTMVEYCQFTRESYFLDIGSGVGKPVLHAMMSVSPVISLGIEMDRNRHFLSMINLKAIINDESFDRFADNAAVPANFLFTDATKLDSLVSLLVKLVYFAILTYPLF